MKHVWLDSGYNGQDTGKEWIEQNLGWTAEILRHPQSPRGVWTTLSADEIDWSKILPPSEFRVLPRRWVMERTFSRFGQSRRMSKDYEKLRQTGEAMIYATLTKLMTRRLAQN